MIIKLDSKICNQFSENLKLNTFAKKSKKDHFQTVRIYIQNNFSGNIKKWRFLSEIYSLKDAEQ